MSVPRMKRYVDACNGDTRKAMTLYRLNLHLSQDMFTVISCFEVALRNAIDRILSSKETYQHTYTHEALLSDMEFGVWKYMFAPNEYRATGRNLLRVFPNKPRSSAEMQYNHSFIFNELDKINRIRTRIAHHEPICFGLDVPLIDTSYVINQYQRLQTMFAWMGIDARALLYGLDHVQSICNSINRL